jgi:hypothetical protein
VIDDLPVEQLIKQAAPARTSVSSEAFGQWNKKEDFTPTVHPKPEETKKK